MSTKKDLYNRRPTSPHLTVYRLPLAPLMSIMHRMTGVVMYFSLSLVSWCMIMIFTGIKDEPRILQYYNDFFIFKLGLVGISYAFIYHFCTGIRHLFWDVGRGYEINNVIYSGIFIIITSLTLTILFWSTIL